MLNFEKNSKSTYVDFDFMLTWFNNGHVINGNYVLTYRLTRDPRPYPRP